MPMKSKKIFLLFLSFLSLVVVFRGNSRIPATRFEIKKDSLPDSLFVNIDTTGVTYENLYAEIIKKEIKFPKIVWAQAILESGHFKSSVFKTNNNLFGMMMPRKRKTVALSSPSVYAKYESWQASVYDYKLY